MRPRVCPSCTASLGREVRHAQRRLCSQVRAERRRDKAPERRIAEAERQRDRRAIVGAELIGRIGGSP